jgi:hypothetical protein
MYELKEMERYLRVNMLGPGPSSYKKIIYRAAVTQRLGNTGIAGSRNVYLLLLGTLQLIVGSI